MKSRAVFPLVLSMALPMALSMLVNSLYNIVDSFFIARISEKAMTAISLVFPLQNIASAVSIGFGPVPAMGIEGGAAATVIGQAVSLGIYLALYLRGGLGPVRISLSEGWRERRLAGRIYGVGIPAILNQALPSLLITALNGILAAVSDTGVLVLGIYYKLQTFIFLTTNGIVQGIRPIISYNYGAGEYERVHRIFRTALLCALVVMSAGVVLCLGMPETLIRLFASDEDVVRSGAEALRIISIGFLFSAVSFSVCGTMEALGRGFSSFIISLLRYAAVILPLALLLSRWMGETGVWHAFWITEVIAAAVSALLYRRMWSKERGRQSI